MPASNNNLEWTSVLQRYKDEEIFEFLECALSSVNERGVDGNTPLHIACERENLDEVLALINGGADVNAIGDMWTQPLHIAAASGKLQIVKALMRAGANPMCWDHFRRTPLSLATANGHNEIIAILESAPTASLK
jgi:ankyrin repeat protein